MLMHACRMRNTNFKLLTLIGFIDLTTDVFTLPKKSASYLVKTYFSLSGRNWFSI